MKRLHFFTGLSFLVGAFFFFYGCASIISGSKQQMTFQSTPEGATVSVNGRLVGKTPISIQLDKKSGQSLEFKKDGYQPVTMELTTHLDGWFWGNIILGGFIGSTTDGISGAVHEYSPSQYYVTLQPVSVTNLEFQTDNTNRAKVKEFIIVGYKGIKQDLDTGAGEYLDSLFTLLMIKPDAKERVIERIRQIHSQTSSIPEFAEMVIKEYLK
jgi:hypothetical protein